MRFSLLLVFLLVISHSLFAQSVEQKVADEVCGCLGEAEAEEVDNRLKKCFPLALAKILDQGNEHEKQRLATVGNIKAVILEANLLMENACPIVRNVVLKNKKNHFYIPSTSEKANEFFGKGNELLARNYYPKAVKKYKKALRADEYFVPAMDKMAIAFREMKNYKESIVWCERSLSVFPEGNVALHNIAVAYSLNNELEKSLDYFKKLNQYYPNEPEGYYEIAKIFLLTENYEEALDNILVAHKIFVMENASKRKESQELIDTLYHKFNALNKSDFFLSRTEGVETEISFNEIRK